MAADLSEQLPRELLHAERKAAVIEYIRATSLPSRFKRRLLQDWKESNPEDYERWLKSQEEGEEGM